MLGRVRFQKVVAGQHGRRLVDRVLVAGVQDIELATAVAGHRRGVVGVLRRSRPSLRDRHVSFVVGVVGVVRHLTTDDGTARGRHRDLLVEPRGRQARTGGAVHGFLRSKQLFLAV